MEKLYFKIFLINLTSVVGVYFKTIPGTVCLKNAEDKVDLFCALQCLLQAGPSCVGFALSSSPPSCVVDSAVGLPRTTPSTGTLCYYEAIDDSKTAPTTPEVTTVASTAASVTPGDALRLYHV
ncbi:hypothetical protein FHG87_006218 [Trinorchestia longiramus]|nr:hypothetical protein FHG87_006218 [Trinorchestia longiramus]